MVMLLALYHRRVESSYLVRVSASAASSSLSLPQLLTVL